MPNNSYILTIVVAVASGIFTSAASLADTPPGEAKSLTFEQHVAPILKERCWRCHAGAEPKADLRLTSRRELLTGGVSGPAIRIAAAESSLLWEKLAANEMPKEGPLLSAEEKGILRSWINGGAHGTDEANDQVNHDVEESSSKASDFWSFQPPRRPVLPSVRHAEQVRNPVDHFVLAKLESHNLSFSPEANRENLLRRVYFDLVGLPPSPEEIKSFLEDDSPASYENLVNRLLANPHYGERWGRHWLDVAGYTDSAGVLGADMPLPIAYRYRNYVVQAFNKDKPYDRFLQEQIAGDELTDYWSAHDKLDRLPDEVIEAITATGYLRCAPDSSRPDFITIKNADSLYYYPTIHDTLQIVVSSTMGLTLQCARCHSHKYDPIPQTEFYRLESIFMTALRPQQWIPQSERRLPLATAAEEKTAAARDAEINAEIDQLKQQQDDLREQTRKRFLEQQLNTVSKVIRDDVRAALQESADTRNTVQAYLADKFRILLPPEGEKLDELLSELFPDYQTAAQQHHEAMALQER